MSTPQYLINGPRNAKRTVILAHGAGAGMDSPFMEAFADGLAEQGIRVVRFEFPYMAKRRQTGGQRPPDRAAVLLETWKAVFDDFADAKPVIGGKSMGGRIASLIADDCQAAGLVCLGYPFHPPGKPEKTRTEHLQELKTPALILQGSRDALGSRDDVEGYSLSSAIKVRWLEDGDHSFKPRRSSGRTEQQNWDEALKLMSEFIATC